MIVVRSREQKEKRLKDIEYELKMCVLKKREKSARIELLKVDIEREEDSMESLNGLIRHYNSKIEEAIKDIESGGDPTDDK